MSTTLRFASVTFFALSAALTPGCECSSPGTMRPDICGLPDAPSGCGALCSPAVPCFAGTHCSDNHCAAECSSTHPCANGARCSTDGTCGGADMDGAVTMRDGAVDAPIVPRDAPAADHTCAATSVGTTLATPNVLVIVDQSGSMDTNQFPPGSGVSRWDALQAALMANPDGLVFPLQASVRWGMAWYHGGTGCPDNTTTVACALNNYAAIDAQYGMLTAGGTTPTGEAIEEILTRIDTLIDDPSQPTIFILATDGDPNTCADRNATGPGQAMSVAAVQHAYAMGIETYVISVGTDTTMANLQEVANAGVNGTGTVHIATDTASLADALTTIVGGVVSCNLTLDGMIDPAQACSGTVRLGDPGTTLICNDPNGWHAVDATHIQLDGTACDMLLAGARPLTATFPCGVILM